jgi:low temperature requirement protein LtrA
LVETPLRSWLWFSAIGFDLTAGIIAGRRPGWNLNPARFVERHALFVIIVLD